jgi:hypothetical protein
MRMIQRAVCAGFALELRLGTLDGDRAIEARPH